MSSLDYQSEAFRQGAERLRLLGKHAELVMQSYYGQAVDELDQSLAIKRLLEARIYSHVDEQSGPKLSEPARQLIAQLIADERRRKVNPEIGDFLQEIRTRTNQINQARQQANHSYADQLFARLQHEVDDLNSRIIAGLESLWNRLNSDFAFVGNLSEKMLENQKASKEVERWLEGLKMIDFAELISLCGSNPQLRTLLVKEFQEHVSEHFTRLREVQQRLIALLARFRQQHARNRLVRGMLEHLTQQANFKPSDYSQRIEVPDLFNRARPLIAASSPTLDRQQDCATLQHLLQALPPSSAPRALPDLAEATQALPDKNFAIVQARQRALQHDVENYYLDVWQQRQSCSALEWLNTAELSWDAETWLYQVIAAYEGLNAEEKKLFQLNYHEQPASPTNNLMIIHDLTLTPEPIT